MPKVTGRKNTCVFYFAVLVIASIYLTGCNSAAEDNVDGSSVSDTVYTIGGINIVMKGISSVESGNLGFVDLDDSNLHTVSLSAYHIGETEVSQELWQAVMDGNPSDFNGSSGKEVADGEEQIKRPVEMVNWYESIVFCNKLTAMIAELGEAQCVYYNDKGFTAVYTTEDAAGKALPYADWSKNGFRLPTETEWEWAAKGGQNYKWAGTNDAANLKSYAWYKNAFGGDSDGKSHEIKKKFPNGYGLYDMNGNVSEWCWDWYEEPFPNSLPGDYKGADSGTYKVARGGNLRSMPDFCFCAYRLPLLPSNQFSDLGLRMACR